MLLSVILPTKGRGEQAARCINRLFETTQGFDVEVFIVAHPEEETRVAFSKLLPKRRPITVDWVDCTPIQGHNIGGAQAKGTHLLALDDDGWCGENWLAKVMTVFDTISTNMGYVKIRDDGKNYWAERAVGSRNFYTELLGGTLDIPEYISQYDDVEKTDRAIAAGIFYQSDAYIEHRTWVYGKAQLDSTYINGSKKYCEIDRKLYEARRSKGFPNSYKRILF